MRVAVYQDAAVRRLLPAMVVLTVLLALIGAATTPRRSACELDQPCKNGAALVCVDPSTVPHACTCAAGWSAWTAARARPRRPSLSRSPTRDAAAYAARSKPLGGGDQAGAHIDAPRAGGRAVVSSCPDDAFVTMPLLLRTAVGSREEAMLDAPTLFAPGAATTTTAPSLDGGIARKRHERPILLRDSAPRLPDGACADGAAAVMEAGSSI